MRGYIKWQHVQHSLLYLQTNALGTVDYLEIEYLSKVHPEVGVQGATVCSWNFFVIIKDLGEKRAPGNIFSSSFFGPKHEENKRDENIHKTTVKVQFIIITETPANRCDIPTCDKYSAIKFSHFNKKTKQTTLTQIFTLCWLVHTCLCFCCVYLGHSSLAVMFADADSSGIRMASPGFLRILRAFSLTHCSMEPRSGLSGGSGFGGGSSVGPSDSLTSCSSSSPSVSSCAWPFFFFFCFFFLAFWKQWTWGGVCVGISLHYDLTYKVRWTAFKPHFQFFLMHAWSLLKNIYWNVSYAGED